MQSKVSKDDKYFFRLIKIKFIEMNQENTNSCFVFIYPYTSQKRKCGNVAHVLTVAAFVRQYVSTACVISLIQGWRGVKGICVLAIRAKRS